MAFFSDRVGLFHRVILIRVEDEDLSTFEYRLFSLLNLFLFLFVFVSSYSAVATYLNLPVFFFEKNLLSKVGSSHLILSEFFVC